MNIRVLGEDPTSESTDSSTEVSYIFNAMDENGKAERDGDQEVVFKTCDGYEMTVSPTYTLPEAMLRGTRDLSESAAVLRILLGFMGPSRRQPALEDEPFDIQLAVAEAAEKYSVSSAMNFCRYLFSQTLPLHSLEILAFATRHRYEGLINKAAPLVLQTRLLDVLEVLPSDWTLPWVRYATKWQEIPMEKARLIEKIPRARDPSLKRACYLEPGCAGHLLSLMTQMKSLSTFERGKVEIEVEPCLERWCICGTLLEEILDPTKCLGPFYAYAPPSAIADSEGDGVTSGVIFKSPAEPLSAPAPAPVPVDSKTDSEDLTAWLEGVTKKVKDEEDAFEAERVFRLEEEGRAEQGAQDRVDAYLEREAISNQEKASGHRLTEEEMDQMLAKEKQDRLRAEEEERRRLRLKEEEQFRADEEAELLRLEEDLRKAEEEKLAQKAAAAELKKAREKVYSGEPPPPEQTIKPKKKRRVVEASTSASTSLFASNPVFGASTGWGT